VQEKVLKGTIKFSDMQDMGLTRQNVGTPFSYMEIVTPERTYLIRSDRSEAIDFWLRILQLARKGR
jgi:hypothetical protein